MMKSTPKTRGLRNLIAILLGLLGGVASASPPIMTAQAWAPTVDQNGAATHPTNVFAMNWCNCGGTPAAAVSEAGDRLQGNKTSGLAANPNGAILCYGYQWSAPVAKVTYQQLLVASPNSAADYQWFSSWSRGMLARGARPPFVVTDFEGAAPAGWNWLDSQFNIALATRNGGRSQYAALTFAMQDAGFAGTPPVVLGTGSVCPAAANYTDSNGYVYPACGFPGYTPGGSHCPFAYLNGGNAYAGGLNPTWENFCGCVHQIECGSLGALPPTPCIAYITYRGDGQPTLSIPTNLQCWLTSRLLLHTRAAGCQTLIYFNPAGKSPYDDLFFGGYLAMANAAAIVPATSITIEPKGSQSVTTGSVVTTYAQFQAMAALDH